MKSVDYSYLITEEDKLRISFRKKKGRINHFIVQYSSLINRRWRSIMRIDTCHGYAHKHTFHLHDKEYIVNLTEMGDDLNKVFTESENYVKTNFVKIKNNFLSN
jgi:hypothetical protein